MCTGSSFLKNYFSKLSLSFLLVFSHNCVFSQTSESFTNIPASASASAARTWTGDNGGTWNAVSARTDQTISGKAICITTTTGKVTSNTVAGGCAILTFNHRIPFAETSPTLTVWVNGTQYGGSISTSGTTTAASVTVNVSGNVQIEIRTGGNFRISIDDIDWTAFAACTAPTTQASSFSSNSITANSMNITFNRGNGTAGVLVLARATSAVNADPIGGTTYTASSTFASGDQIGTGNYVVYNGAASGTGVASGNIPITGLSALTTYHFAIYEYNTTGTCYHLTELVGNATTICGPAAEPTTQATGISTSSITCNSATINFTRSTTATNSIVVLSTDDCSGASFTDPSDQTNYNASTVYSSGGLVGPNERVVYRGTGGLVTITGLTNGTTYYYKIYSYNGTSANCTENYLLSPACNTFITGPAAEPTTNATGVSSTASCNSATINFTRSTTATHSLIVFSTDDCSGGSFTEPTDQTNYTASTTYTSGSLVGANEYVVYKNTGNSVVVTGLSIGTYYYKIYSFNGTVSNCTENYLLSAACGSVVVSSATEPTTNATGISAISTCTNATISFTRSTTATNSIVVLSTDDCSGASFTDPSDQTNYNASTVYSSGGLVGPNERVVYRGTGGSVTITGLTNGTTYYYKIYSYNGTTANCNENYLLSAACNSFVAGASASEPTTNATGTSETPDCDRATINFTRSTTATNSLIVLSTDNCSGGSFTDVSDQTNYTANAAYGSGTLVGPNERVVYKGTGNSVSITGLSPSTTYYYKIYSYNGTTSNCNENYLLSADCRSFTTPLACTTPQIKLILVNSCANSTDEGIDEFVIVQNGTSSLAVSDMVITFPTGDIFCNSGCGTNTLINNAAHITALNTAAGCTLFQYADPIPANGNLVIFTGLSPSSVVDFTASCPGPYYAVFCNNANTSGRFGNEASANRTLSINFGSSTDEVTYFSSTANTGDDGDYAEFTASGTCSYGNSPTCAALLPIELTYFLAKCSIDDVLVKWETESERNNDYFTLEFSIDGYNFSAVGKVKGAGSSSSVNKYSLSSNQKSGYFRLKQTDFDGKFTYSDVISINCDNEDLLVYPNPNNGTFTIKFDSADKVLVYDQIGKLIREYPAFKESLYLNLEDLSSGVYHLNVVSKDRNIYKKIEIQK